jgi:hypothetical protein
MIKSLVKRTPVVREIARAALRILAEFGQERFSSSDYWEGRYRKGGNSGAGSYNRLARYKADVLNAFVAEHGIESVIEFGSGDGAQLKLATYPSYIGVDVSHTALDLTRREFAADPSKRFVHSEDLTADHRADLSLSLDVIYHLIEDSVFERYMNQLFDAARRYTIIYSSNAERKSEAVHVRHRKFTDWVERERKDFKLIGQRENDFSEDIEDTDNTSFADFYFYERTSSITG